MGNSLRPVPPQESSQRPLPQAWRELIRLCQEMKHGEIERLAIQDGLPVLAELTRKKVKFTREP